MAAPNRSDIHQLDLLNGATRSPQAAFIVPASRHHFEVHRDVWRPRLMQIGALDSDWDWLADFDETEAPSLEWESYALIDTEGALQGLISLQLQVDIVYVDRLAVAPWNRPGATPRQLLGCGFALLVHAIRKSVAKGYRGRLSLHSLEDPETLRFYRERIKMEEIRIDTVDGTQMRYFELTEAIARALIEGTKP